MFPWVGNSVKDNSADLMPISAAAIVEGSHDSPNKWLMLRFERTLGVTTCEVNVNCYLFKDYINQH